MKKLIRIIFASMVILLSGSPIHAFDGEGEGGISIILFPSDNDDGKVPELPGRGNRLPSRRLECIITHEGITIPGYNTEDILAYEIYTVDGVPVASFVDEEDFITFIFSAEGAYEIRLQFEEVILKGYINL